MTRRKARVLNPIGVRIASGPLSPEDPRATASEVSIGFIDNSKPNVHHVIGTLREELCAADAAEGISTTKPRSAGPSPDIALLRAHCRVVVNGVAD